MSLVAEFTIPTESLPGGNVLRAEPDIRVELERIVPSKEAALPFFWVWGDDPDDFLDQFEADSEIRGVKVLDRVEEGVLVRAQWAPETAMITALEGLDATILEAVGADEEWRFQIRASDRERFTEFRGIFTDHDIPVELIRLYNFAELVEDEHYTITAKQREALIEAFRRGYFEDPRAASQEDLGTHFGISGRAVSKRLRLGTRNLIANTLATSPFEADSEDGDRPH